MQIGNLTLLYEDTIKEIDESLDTVAVCKMNYDNTPQIVSRILREIIFDIEEEVKAVQEDFDLYKHHILGIDDKDESPDNKFEFGLGKML